MTSTETHRRVTSTHIDIAVAALLSGNTWPWETVIDDIREDDGSLRKIDEQHYPVKFIDLPAYKSIGRVRGAILRTIRRRTASRQRSSSLNSSGSISPRSINEVD